ncbi:MAG: hypothetical protein IJ029_09630 [Lachnospiraceae bacterium]|nr:hypothetical protein [Lachnospiraceae bacterium]
MNNLNRIMLMLIAMAAIMLIAVGIDKGYDYYQDAKWEKERVVAYEQAKAEVETMQTTIETLSEDPEALIAYIEENELNYVEVENTEEVLPIGEGQTDSERETDTTQDVEQDVSGNALDDSSSASMSFDDEQSVSDNESDSTESVSGNGLDESDSGSVSDNSVSDNSVSDNSVSDNSVSDNSISDNSVSGNLEPFVSGNSKTEKKLCASYEDTLRINKEDKAVIAANTIDFSGMKIACLGDSITEAANLTKLEGYEQMTYPYHLSQLLGAREVVNLGIGGSSIGRYWDNAFVDRYREIPQDTDLIIVMGGTNDGFCASLKELGSLAERSERTFAGDLNELIKGLKEDYPEADIVLVSPLPNVLHDMLRRERAYLLSQAVFADMMQQLATEYGVHYIDLYHSNLLDTHDAAIIHNFMPDGVHGNEAGYRILAEHIAAEIIRMYESSRITETEEEQSHDA